MKIPREKKLSECSDKELLEELAKRWVTDIGHATMTEDDVRHHCLKLLERTTYRHDNNACLLCLS